MEVSSAKTQRRKESNLGGAAALCGFAPLREKKFWPHALASKRR
jgi:hypothetical protein